jgi:hypothetical protein
MKIPGSGDPLVLITIEVLLLPHDKLKIRNALCGNELLLIKSWKLVLPSAKFIF